MGCRSGEGVRMRVIFMGTPGFAVPTLRALAEGHEVAAVYTQPPRPAGRGRRARPSPVQDEAERLGLQVRHPRTLRDAEAQAALAAFAADVAVVAAYGLILPQAVLDAPRRGCLNVHASLLPRWRGAAPIHRAVMAGDARTGVCVMRMEAGLDTGPVLLRGETEIDETDTTGDLHDRLAELGAALMLQALDGIETLTPVPQPEHGVTYAAKVTKEEAAIDWARPSEEVARHVNGLSPAPGAYVGEGAGRLRLLRARASRGADGPAAPGTVLEAGPRLRLACGSGSVEVLELQPAGKGAMAAADWLRGARVAEGERW
jgi:methionyl-tRNA formyltransferase